MANPQIQELAQKHQKIRELREQIRVLDEERKELESEVLSFLVENDLKSLKQDGIGKIGFTTKRGVACSERTRLALYLVGSEKETLITVNSQSLTKAYNDDPEFFKPYAEECGITEAEYNTLTLTK